MDKRDERQAVKDCLATPGAKILLGKLRAASVGTLRKYDKCKPEELIRLQMLRAIINDELPRIIESIINPPQTEKRFDWRKMIGIKDAKHK
jgi:hypothetical protein